MERHSRKPKGTPQRLANSTFDLTSNLQMQAQYSLRQILLNSAALDGTAAAGRAVHVLFEAGAMAESLELLDIAALA